MKQLSILIKPSSSLCNLRCKYCFYADLAGIRENASFGFMTDETVERMLENIRRDLSPGDRVTFAFQGGEPTLSGLPFFRHFTELVARWDPVIRVSYSIQTNATLLNDEWCRFLAEHLFLVGGSLDMLPESHNAVRVDAGGSGTYGQVRQAISLLEKHRVEYNVLCTLTNEIARYPKRIWSQLCKLDIRYVQFTPCLDELEKSGESIFALTPRRFSSFYKGLFPLWLESLQKGNYRSIKFFDDVVNLMAFGIPTACGINGVCQPQVVIEADGSVYPCDFYCLDCYSMGNITRNRLSDMQESPGRIAFLNREHRIPKLCGSCRYARFCGGNCKRMQRQICYGETDDYCGYQDFLDTCGGALQQIAKDQRRRHGFGR